MCALDEEKYILQMQLGLHFAYILLVFFFLQDVISAQPSIQFQGLQGVSILYFCNTVQHKKHKHTCFRYFQDKFNSTFHFIY